MHDSHRLRPAWRIRALTCACCAIALVVGARLVSGPQSADIHVEWQPFVDQVARQQLEVRFGLTNPRKLEERYSWRYTLTDASSGNIRALVTDSGVEDTHHIDRSRYTLEATAPLTERRQRLPSAGGTMVGVADGIGAFFVLLAALALATRTTPLQALQRGIPELDAATTGLFRIGFGSALLAFFAANRMDSSRLFASTDPAVLGGLHAAVFDWLRGHPLVADLLTPWLLATAAAFTVGIFTRLTYALFVAGVFVWAYVAVAGVGTHPHSPLVLALVALLPSRWGDAWSVDSWLRRGTDGVRSVRASTGRAYGYSVWIPGLILGLAFAAAAWAKLAVPAGWTDWIANGTVKYHFVGDSVNAPVEWGVQLAAFPRLAILASFAAVATEALVISASFIRNDWYRLTIGGGALALLSGFGLFMGVFWSGWWILLMGFLPWRRIAGQRQGVPLPRSAAISGPGHLRPGTRAQPAMITAVVAQQFVVSSLTLERAPMFSWYPMYSGTYSSAEEWNSKRPPVHQIVLSTVAGGMQLAQCSTAEPFVRDFETATQGVPEAATRVRHHLLTCGTDLAQVRSVILEVYALSFDWDRLAFRTSHVRTLGPLALDEEPLP